MNTGGTRPQRSPAAGMPGAGTGAALSLRERAAQHVARFRREVAFYRLVLAHPRTPRVSRWLLGAAIAYAISPIDLIPDFVPILGHLDDLVIVPLLIWLGLRLIPKDVLSACRQRAGATHEAAQVRELGRHGGGSGRDTAGQIR